VAWCHRHAIRYGAVNGADLHGAEEPGDVFTQQGARSTSTASDFQLCRCAVLCIITPTPAKGFAEKDIDATACIFVRSLPAKKEYGSRITGLLRGNPDSACWI
jgi:hypothetical protein